jgi:hypothetical protein
MGDALEHKCEDELEYLRALDIERVELLNHLVTAFVEQYLYEGISLSSFVRGPWWEQVDRIEAEEKKVK